MKKYGILNRMPFGKAKGELVGTVMETKPDYIEWLLANTDFRLDDHALKYLGECHDSHAEAAYQFADPVHGMTGDLSYADTCEAGGLW